ncbi:hypothetical protein ABUW04_38575 [Streptacidiphilus sp. N1-10]|uniref:Secreted protein n=1 Tax=Streptacidiphilus jeojiensis TaxID=3229225 RepID=A0ABV6Y0X8_9ACTN
MVSELPLLLLEPDVLPELLDVLLLDALLLLAVGLELGVDSPLVLDEAEDDAEEDAEDDGVDAEGVVVDVVGVEVVSVVPVSAVVEVDGIAAISARVPATLTTATPALTAEVRFAPLRAVSGVRPALRAITLLRSLGWCGPWSVLHHPEGAL